MDSIMNQVENFWKYKNNTGILKYFRSFCLNFSFKLFSVVRINYYQRENHVNFLDSSIWYIAISIVVREHRFEA